MIVIKNKLRYASALGAAFCAVLLALVMAGRADASGCRADPILVLSNGAQLQMAVSISTSYSNVQSIVYTVHAPVGSVPMAIVYTDNPLGSLERVNYIADGPQNRYSIDTVVYTGNGNAQVTATSALVNALRVTLANDRANGLERQHLAMSLSR